MEASDDPEEPPLPLPLTRFQVSEEFGFLLPDPLTELPVPYSPWMDMARELPQLITSHRLRSRVQQMPQLSTQHLRGREELHLAHLVLSFITMGYVWQEGEEGTVQVLPRNLAVPFWEVSQALGLPPILSHADFVLANWRRKDPNGPLEIENLDTIITLPGGESLRGFILVTLLVEKAAVPGIKAITQALGAVVQGDEETLHRALQELAGAVEAMSKALRRMHDYVDPEVFYSVIRIFLSGFDRRRGISLSFHTVYTTLQKAEQRLFPLRVQETSVTILLLLLCYKSVNSKKENPPQYCKCHLGRAEPQPRSPVWCLHHPSAPLWGCSICRH
nr:indoleamine 2,3-dioxygenase 2 isoform X4 [Taeniopygia guttata]